MDGSSHINSGHSIRSEETAAEPAGHAPMRNIAAGTQIVLSGKIFGRGMQFLTQLLMARFLGPKVFGFYAIVWSLVTLFRQFAPIGLTNAVVRFGAKYWRRDYKALSSVVVKAFLLGWGVSLLITVALILAAPWIASSVFDQPALSSPLRILSLLIPFSSTLYISVAVTRISQRMRFGIFAEEVVRGGLNLVLFLLLFFLGMRLFGAVLACVASFAGASLLAFYYVRKLYPEVNIRAAFESSEVRVKSFVFFSLATAFSGVFGNILYRADRLLLGYFRPASEVGLYHGAAQLPIVITVLLGGMNMVFAPAAAHLSHEGKAKELQQMFQATTKWRFYLACPFVIVMVVVPEHILGVAFGPEYAVASRVLVILAMAQLLNAATGSGGAILMMSGLQKCWLLMTLAMMGLNLGMNALLIPRLGMTGAALTTLVTANCLYALALIAARYRLGIIPYNRRYWKGGLAGFAALAAAYAVKLFLNVPPFVLLVGVATVVFVVFPLSLLLCGLDPEDRTFIGVLTNRITRRRNRHGGETQ